MLLLSGKYNPTEVVTILKNKPPEQFDEDELIKNKTTTIKKTQKVKRKRKTKPTLPSLRYQKEYTSFLDGKNNGSPEAVLGCYFLVYKKLFGEEDSRWNVSNFDEAIIIIRSFCREATENNFNQAIAFIRKLLPLWKRQLIQQSDFPTSRPTIEALFGKKRYFWSNRKLFYKKWKPREEY